MFRSSYLSGITKYWWLPLLSGLICIGLGVWSICCPSGALPVMAWIFAIGIIAIGVFDLIWGLATTGHNPAWGWDLCLGVIDLIVGIWMLNMPQGEMTLTFLYIIGIWLIFAGFNGLGQMFGVSLYNPFLTVIGILLLAAAIVVSFWLILTPLALSVATWIWIGVALCCYGVFRVAISFKIKSLHNRLS